MSIEQEQVHINKLRYGFKAKIFKDGLFSQAHVYLDTVYDNFLWITTDENAFLVDLCYTKISCYSLELEYQIKYESGYKGDYLPRYILLKQLNTEIPIIFDEPQVTGYSSESDLNKFVDGKRPTLFNTFHKYIELKNQSCTYSSNFSRYFKKMRLQWQSLQTEHFTQITSVQLVAITNQIEQLTSIDKTMLIQQNQTYLASQALDVLKTIYCKLFLSAIKSLNGSEPVGFFKKGSSFLAEKIINLGQGELLTCFDALKTLEDAEKNYIIADYQIDQGLPLTDYFCFSSHNTYLTGNQLTSDCKVTRYLEDLKKGIKCVELDVHNKGDNQPIITHAIKGKGFCKPITFRQTIQAIDEFLEYNPQHYPIILSIQNHATRQNQDLMNNILRKQFPKCILTPMERTEFYKLSEVKGKIIVKTSCNLDNLIQFRNNDQIPKIKSYDPSFNNNFVFTESNISNGSRIRTTEFSVDSENNYDKNEAEAGDDQNPSYKAFVQKIKKYKKLKVMFNQRIDQTSYLPVQKIVQITCLFKAPKGIQTAKPNPFQCASMQNSKIAKTSKEKVVTYTKQSWLRSYPEGSQIYSNNYDFMDLLLRGVQIIALNTQTNDDYAIMMNSYFRSGRKGTMQKIGYIQKPEYLRNSNNKSSVVYPSQRSFQFTFFTNYQLQFKLYSIDNSQIEETIVSGLEKRIQFRLGHYNQSFLIIKIGKKWVQCIPLRFLNYEKKNHKIFRVVIGRDYEFEDAGVRIPTIFKFF